MKNIFVSMILVLCLSAPAMAQVDVAYKDPSTRINPSLHAQLAQWAATLWPGLQLTQTQHVACQLIEACATDDAECAPIEEGMSCYISIRETMATTALFQDDVKSRIDGGISSVEFSPDGATATAVIRHGAKLLHGDAYAEAIAIAEAVFGELPGKLGKLQLSRVELEPAPSYAYNAIQYRVVSVTPVEAAICLAQKACKMWRQ